MAKYQIKYSVWRHRILPILELSGWEQVTEKNRTYMLNRTSGYRFEYMYYGNSSPVNICDPEPIG